MWPNLSFLYYHIMIWWSLNQILLTFKPMVNIWVSDKNSQNVYFENFKRFKFLCNTNIYFSRFNKINITTLYEFSKKIVLKWKFVLSMTEPIHIMLGICCVLGYYIQHLSLPYLVWQLPLCLVHANHCEYFIRFLYLTPLPYLASLFPLV